MDGGSARALSFLALLPGREVFDRNGPTGALDLDLHHAWGSTGAEAWAASGPGTPSLDGRLVALKKEGQVQSRGTAGPRLGAPESHWVARGQQSLTHSFTQEAPAHPMCREGTVGAPCASHPLWPLAILCPCFRAKPDATSRKPSSPPPGLALG